jgi:hypothetical protein
VIILETTNSNAVTKLPSASMLVASRHAPVDVTLAEISTSIEGKNLCKKTSLAFSVASQTDDPSLTGSRVHHEARQTPPPRLLRAGIRLRRLPGLQRGKWTLPSRTAGGIVSPRHPNSSGFLVLARECLHGST